MYTALHQNNGNRPIDWILFHLQESLYLRQYCGQNQQTLDAIDVCTQNNLLPRSIVSEAAVHHELKELNLNLALYNRTLAIPIEHLSIYYTTLLASCTIDKTNISNVHIF
jgi:hypothetical protein